MKKKILEYLKGIRGGTDELQLVEQSGLFDAMYYVEHNKDVATSGVDPLSHFLIYGGVEGRSPSKDFDTKYYLSQSADVRESKVNPLLHYLLSGKAEGRKIVRNQKDNRTKRAISATKKVDIVNVNFYDITGKTLYKGGAERYVFDLACLLKALGYEVRILQNSLKDFTKKYRGIEIVGVATGETEAHGRALRRMSAVFNRVCSDADLVVASPLDLACEIDAIPVVGINHGIHWDSIKKSLHNNKSSDYMEVFDALDNIKIGVCVDTNFINWTRTYDYNFGEKLKYVPNYYDKESFRSSVKNFSGRLKVMYPRRLYDARGIYLTLDAFDVLMKSYKDIDLLLVGQTDDPKVKRCVNKLIKKYPRRVTLEEYDMEDMHKAYKKSNVVLIPTRYGEGTSLSCIEAMATNNAVIATNVGGLPNLIIDGYNGLLIDPSARSLIEAVELLHDNRDIAEKFANKAVDMAGSFDKSKWDKRWTKIIKELL